MEHFKLKFAGIGKQVINVFEKCGATSEEEVKALDYEDIKKVIETKHANRVDMPEIYWGNLIERCNVVLFKVKNPDDAVPYFPDYLVCQLSFNLLKDPVISPSGYTYERSELEKWVNEFHNDPITREKLEMNQVISNRAIQDASTHYDDCFVHIWFDYVKNNDGKCMKSYYD